MSAGAALLAYAYLAHWQIHIVAYYDDVGESRFEAVYQLPYRLSAEVHECGGLGQHYRCAVDIAGAESGTHAAFAPPPFFNLDSVAACEVVEALETDVMPIVSISFPRIPKTDYKFHSIKMFC